jgi:RHS repeat-associated protein
MAEYDAGLNKKAEYVYGRGIDEVLYRIDTLGNVFYYHTDHLGSVTEVTDTNENVRHSFEYDEYGNFITEPISYEATYFYAGRRYDPETGLYYNRNRYYNPALGRFMTPDPAGMIDGPNLYTYVRNNPVRFVDPWGLCADEGEDTLREQFEDWIKKYGIKKAKDLIVETLKRNKSLYSPYGPFFDYYYEGAMQALDGLDRIRDGLQNLNDQNPFDDEFDLYQL